MTTAYANTIEEAMAIPNDGQGWFLVLSEETLNQIRSAEEAGGFEGGMSGASGQGGFSAPGSTGRPSSSDSELPAELLDLEEISRSRGCHPCNPAGPVMIYISSARS
jgi:hypothetical protein